MHIIYIGLLYLSIIDACNISINIELIFYDFQQSNSFASSVYQLP